ncbi:MAG: hypothetical protein RIQ88_1046 [Actinomycetota bacterium]|jgi:predicted  nucleic acid-binding Zn-ribbon protein
MTDITSCSNCYWYLPDEAVNVCPNCGLSLKVIKHQESDHILRNRIGSSDDESEAASAANVDTHKSSALSQAGSVNSADYKNQLVTNELLESLISTQLLTVFAVRSLAVFLFTFLSSFSLGLAAVIRGAIDRANCDYNCGYADGMSYFGYAVIIVGFITALIAGAGILSASNPKRLM